MKDPSPYAPYFKSTLSKLDEAINAKTQEQLRYIDTQLAPLNRIP
jgi:hypothetical protein